MFTKNVLRLQKYVLDLETKALGKGFSLSVPSGRSFVYSKKVMLIGDDGIKAEEKKA